MNHSETADYIIDLYKTYGNADYIGEPVSQLEHMCQCALLAEQEGYDEEVILAAFFHDIGHLCEHVRDVKVMDQFGVADHEKLGADFLRELLFSEKIARLIENHVQAKRYLTFKDEHYYEALSEASKQTLVFQGGRMSANEASAFEEDPMFPFYIQMRRWDEQAKNEGSPLPPLEKYRAMIVDHLNKHKTYAT